MKSIDIRVLVYNSVKVEKAVKSADSIFNIRSFVNKHKKIILQLYYWYYRSFYYNNCATEPEILCTGFWTILEKG